MGFSIFSDLITPTKYDVPAAPNIDINSLGQKTTAANASTFAGAKQLASDYNDFMRQQVMKSLQAGVPGYSGLTDQLSKNLQAQLGGQLTESDAARSQRSSAAQALGLGIGGSAAGGALTARNLGLAQYQVQQNAQAQTPGYLSTMAGLTKAPMYDPASMFLSPMQRAGLDWQNQTSAWGVQNLKNQMAVQPDPWMKSLAGFGDSLVNAATSYFTMNPSFMGSGTGSQGQRQQINGVAGQDPSGIYGGGSAGMGFF